MMHRLWCKYTYHLLHLFFLHFHFQDGEEGREALEWQVLCRPPPLSPPSDKKEFIFSHLFRGCLFLHRIEACSLPRRAVSQMSEVEDSGIPQVSKNLLPMPSRMVMKTMLMKSLTMTTKLVLATLTNLDLELSFSGGRKRRWGGRRRVAPSGSSSGPPSPHPGPPRPPTSPLKNEYLKCTVIPAEPFASKLCLFAITVTSI